MYNYVFKAKNDYEYCIFVRHNNAEPYIIGPYSNIFDLKRHPNDIIDRKDRYNQIFLLIMTFIKIIIDLV